MTSTTFSFGKKNSRHIILLSPPPSPHIFFTSFPSLGLSNNSTSTCILCLQPATPPLALAPIGCVKDYRRKAMLQILVVAYPPQVVGSSCRHVEGSVTVIHRCWIGGLGQIRVQVIVHEGLLPSSGCYHEGGGNCCKSWVASG